MLNVDIEAYLTNLDEKPVARMIILLPLSKYEYTLNYKFMVYSI